MGIAFYTMFFVLNDLALPLFVALPVGAAVAAAAGDRDRGLGPRCAARAPLRQSDVLHLHADPGRIGDLHPHPAVRHRTADAVHQHHCRRCTSSADIAVSDWDLRAVGISVAALVALAALPDASARKASSSSPSPTTPSWPSCTASAHAAPIASLPPSPACSSRWRCTWSARAAAITPNSPLELILTAVIGTLLGGMGRVFMGGLASLVLALIHELLGPGDRLPLAEPADLRLPVRRHRGVPARHPPAAPAHPRTLIDGSGADGGAGRLRRMEYFMPVAVMIAIFVILAASYNLVIGYGGLATVAHPIFFALGAYTAALLAIHTGLPAPLCVLAGAVVATGRLGAARRIVAARVGRLSADREPRVPAWPAAGHQEPRMDRRPGRPDRHSSHHHRRGADAGLSGDLRGGRGGHRGVHRAGSCAVRMAAPSPRCATRNWRSPRSAATP